MITEKGKEYIARNFGVNNCYALEEVVPCTVYTDGTPNERVLDTSTILFVLVTEVAEKVKTSARPEPFTLDELKIANGITSYISMMDTLDIETYCIPGAPPVTPLVTPPVTPPYVPPVTPPTVGLKDFEIVDPSVNCDSYNCEARLSIKNNSNSSTSVYARFDVDGAPKTKRSVYLLRGTTKPLSSRFNFAGISDGYHNLTIAVGKVVDTDTYTHRFLVGAPGIEPQVTPVAKITKAEIITEIGRRGAIDTAAISTVPRANEWYMYYKKANYHSANFEKVIEISNLQTRNPPTQVSDIALSENRISKSELDRGWVLSILGELPYAGVTPPVTPPATPPTTGVSDAIKAWIVANYGDGTRVTTDGWRKLNVAKMANTLAPLPAGYTKASITEGVVLWAKANSNWEIQTICGWISSIGVTNLTEDHGLYVYNLAIGWTTLANSIYDTLSPQPSKPSTALVTEDNGLGVYDYAIGWKTIANSITGCNF